ncbi:histidine ammonia-lyase [Pseudoclavibacter sp. JAI123]|uniref:aromatic amino acid ammonia-lyase n=1 Tax=Pseudoclavibacter sp. JAI123 TaxID=2723065 RepID=UPI0015CA1C53|nr:aromatic amino acid ammonia-lyase [Pseudoclavibacter sp. JAI123]NYF12541.1 histidine ammonia-lyase [Pseudoclavibacter sp. JAI123]
MQQHADAEQRPQVRPTMRPNRRAAQAKRPVTDGSSAGVNALAGTSAEASLPLSSFVIGRDRMTPRILERLAVTVGHLDIDPHVRVRLAEARGVIESVMARGEPAYGVNRGLGPLRDQEIPEELQHAFQLFVLASHDAAVGKNLTPIEARSVMLARLAVMAQGNSGATTSLFEGLRCLLECGVTPAIPSEGSVGAADLSMLAAIGNVLVGRGRVLDETGTQTVPAREALATAGLVPLELAAKDGLALVGANAASVGIAALTSVRLDRFTASADLVVAHTFDALNGSVKGFQEKVVAARPHPGQIRAAARFRSLLGSSRAYGPATAGSLQDPLSMRTVPQVHGTLIEQADVLRESVTVELNARSENPYIDVDNDVIISNGNFSTIQMAITADSVRLLLAHFGIMSERRCSLMIRRLRSERSLVEQVLSIDDAEHPFVPVILANTASSLMARLQQLAAPVSHLGGVVGDGVEDHNAQGYLAVRLLEDSLEAAERLLAIEALLAVGVGVAAPAPSMKDRAPLVVQLSKRIRETLALNDPAIMTSQRIDRVRADIAELSEHVQDA